MKFYLVTTDHLKSAIWFRDEEDFKAAMNVIPILAALAGVNILAFILMSNHVHFVLEGSYVQVLKFFTSFKRHFSYYLNNKYKIKEALRENSVDVRELKLESESLERAIAYVQMNSVAAGICFGPAEYPWGTGGAFFRVTSPKGTPVDDMSARSRYRLFHSKKKVPAGLLLGENGYIIPESYVKTKFVEDLYRRQSRMAHFLRSSSKAKIRMDTKDTEIPSFKDHIIIPVVKEMCRALFGKDSIKDLLPVQKAEILRQIRYRFSSNVNQLVRVTEIPYEDVTRLLETL